MSFTIEKVLAFAFSNESSFLQLKGALTNDLCISNTYYFQLANFYKEFYEQYSSLPKDGDLKIWLADQPETQRKGLKSAIAHIRSQDISDYTVDYVITEAISGLREVATKNAVKRMDSSGKVSPEVMAEMLESINSIQVATLEDIVHLDEVAKWIAVEDPTEIKWKTGIRKLDSYIGGFGEELVFVLAPTGTGKTTALINFGKEAAFQGARVLHITLELFHKTTAHRFYQRIAEAEKEEFIHNRKEMRELVEHWLRYADGSVDILYYPAFSISVNDLKGIVKQYAEQHGNPDFIVVDYLDLLNSDKGFGKAAQQWEKLGRMSHEIRSLCSEYGATVVSAAQTNREGMDATQLQAKHMASSVQKLQAADICLGIVQDEEELQLNQGRLNILKARETGGRGAEIPLFMYMEKMIIMDLDDPDKQRIIKQSTEAKGTNAQRQFYI